MKKVLIILILLLSPAIEVYSQNEVEILKKYCIWDSSVIDVLDNDPNIPIFSKIRSITYTSDIETDMFITELALMFVWGDKGIPQKDFLGFLLKNVAYKPNNKNGNLKMDNIFLINQNSEPVIFFVTWDISKQKWGLFVKSADDLKYNYSHVLKGATLFILK